MQAILQAIRVMLSLLFLGYASWSDIKTREVTNRVWLLYAPLGFMFTLLDGFLYGSSNYWILFGVSVVTTWTLAVALFYLGAFGGADAKAFICLALAFPIYLKNIFNFQLVSGHPIFPLTVFTNSMILAASSVIYILLQNLLWKLKMRSKLFEGLEKEPLWRKILTVLCGYKVSLEKLREKDFYFPLEDIKENDGVLERFLVVFSKNEDRNEILERLSFAVKNKRINPQIWASPGLPMLVFITAGFLVALFFGDIVWFLILLLLG